PRPTRPFRRGGGLAAASGPGRTPPPFPPSARDDRLGLSRALPRPGRFHPPPSRVPVQPRSLSAMPSNHRTPAPAAPPARSTLRALVPVLASALAAAPAAQAQLGTAHSRRAPDVFAITNAKIVTGIGPAIERGTVVVRDGLIAAVGGAVQAPADARVIDGAGLTIYPGLIDANSSLGIGPEGATTTAAATRGGRGGGRGAAPAQQGAPLAAADLVHPEDDAFDGPQSAGITTALTAAPTGIFRGLSALIDLNGANAQAMIVKAPVAEHIGFVAQRGGGYPGSLLGVFAALRQELLDAQHYAAVQAAYAKNPRGMHRPETDPSLEALQPVLSRQIPVIMEASSQREIERARSGERVQSQADHCRRGGGRSRRGAAQGGERAGADLAQLSAPPAGVARCRSRTAPRAPRARRRAQARRQAAGGGREVRVRRRPAHQLVRLS